MAEWSNPCGVAYRWLDDGRFEVAGLGFPSYPIDGAEAALITKVWYEWSPYLVKGSQQSQIPVAWIIAVLCAESGGRLNSRSACTQKLCPALWKKGLCEQQGGPNKFCAGGLMGFTQQAAAMYGRDVDWYFTNHDTEGQQIIDGADLIVRKIAAFKGEVLSGLKNYNGGKPCADTGLAPGPGILNMWGQGGYVEKIVRLSNTFVELVLGEPSKHPPDPGKEEPPSLSIVDTPRVKGIATLLVLGAVFAVAYRWESVSSAWLNRGRTS